MFYVGIILSLIGGSVEAYLFGILDQYLNQKNIGIGIMAISILILARFFTVFLLSHVISKSSSDVVSSLLRRWLINDEKIADREYGDMSVSILSEAERIGMGYFLAWQNLFANLIQLLLLLFAASILATSEFWYFIASITPLYYVLLRHTISSVSHNGELRMKAYRKLSSQMKSALDNIELKNNGELSFTIGSIRRYIYNVRIMSLLQKPTLEFLGVVAIAISIFLTYFLHDKNIASMMISYGVLIGILLRSFPFVNQVQNAITLVSSVHIEVVNSLKNEQI